MKSLLLKIAACLLVCGSAHADITSNRVAHWKFDNSLVDEVGPYTITASAGAYTFSTSALPYSGSGTTHNLVMTSDDVGNTSSNVTGISGAFSIGFWIKTTTTGQIISNHFAGAGSGAITIRMNGDGTIRSATGTNFSSVSTIHDGNWHHVVLTYDGTNTSGLTWYVDGGAADATGTGTDSVNAASGQFYLPNTAGMACEIDDYVIYSRELSVSDVAELYAYTGDAAGITPLIYYYRQQMGR